MNLPGLGISINNLQRSIILEEGADDDDCSNISDENIANRGSNPNLKICDCKARILVVDDTDFNVLAVKLMIKENFMLDIEEA